jgi:predicted MPP superfamily phosphohydrolase
MFSDQSGRRRSHLGWILLTLIAAIIFLALYAAVDGNIVHVERVLVTIPGMDRGFEGFTILHISDLHGKRFGAAQRAEGRDRRAWSRDLHAEVDALR